jgi:hypothetical protein
LLDPIYDCPCDVSVYRDCECDTLDPVYICPCDTSLYRDCECDTLDPVYYCPCDISPYQDCECDTLDPVYDCPCDTTQYWDCECDRDTLSRPVDVISYLNDIQPIWDKYCVECHYDGGDVPNLESAVSYNAIVPDYITTYNLKLSSIYTQVESGVMPDGKDRIPQEDIDKILKWLEQGYKKN